MFNSKNENGFGCGREVVEYKGEKWLLVAEGRNGITIENCFSYDPNYREYSCATGMFAVVEEVKKEDVKPFCSILMKSGTDKEWMDLYKSLDLV